VRTDALVVYSVAARKVKRECDYLPPGLSENHDCAQRCALDAELSPARYGDPHTGLLRAHALTALLLKFLLTPGAVTVATLAGRRWGHQSSGWIIVVFPVTSAATVIAVTLAHGVSFGAAAAAGSLAGAFGQALFALGYSRTPSSSWVPALAVGTLGFASCAAAVRLLPISANLPLPLVPLVAVTVIALTICLHLQPARPTPGSIERRVGRGDVAARAAVATAIVAATSSLAPVLGARLAGMLATFPIGVLVLTVFADRREGRHAASAVLRGLDRKSVV